MDGSRGCSACGIELSADSTPEGHCPNCLLRLALGAESPGSGDEGGIGGYRILRKLGEGGMGEVYLAEQAEPIRRRVALKLIKPGMDSRQVVARFESERQALALMDHPCIAKVFDAGSTEQGRPYFAMEYVEGEPITKHCDRNRLSTSERLELFVRVCEGVQHAHQKGVIHRDLKPSNVLVKIQGGEPVPTIIDFGVAKATQQRLTEKTLFTQVGMLIGTPEYMSPEQAKLTGLDVDTRTDVYSLGVLLYELLVGALPFDPRELREAGFDELRRRIREEEPSRPSTRIGTLGGEASTEAAERRGVDVPTLRRQLRGDLDWITMKALEKEPARRYQSPAELAADLQRTSRDEPVVARPPSRAYRLRKFVRRHRVGVVSGATIALALLLGTTFATLGMIRATRAERAARAEAAAAERVSRFLADTLGSVDPARLGGVLQDDLSERVAEAQRKRGATQGEIETALASFDELTRGVNPTDVAMRLLDEEILDRALETIDEELGDDPLIAARLRLTIGWTYKQLGFKQEGEEQIRQALGIRRHELGPDHPDTLWAMNDLAVSHINRGKYDEAERLLLECVSARKRVLGDDHPTTLTSMSDLGFLYHKQDRSKEAEALLVETLNARRSELGEDHPETFNSMILLARVYRRQSRLDEAEQLLLKAARKSRLVLDDDDRLTMGAMNHLAFVYQDQNRFDEAERILVEVLKTRRRVAGGDHPGTGALMFWLGDVYRRQGRYEEAESIYLEALEVRQRRQGDYDPALYRMLGDLYRDMGRFDEAESMYLESYELHEIQETVLGEPWWNTEPLLPLAHLYSAWNRYDEAEKLYLEILERWRSRIRDGVVPEDHRFLYTLTNLGDVYYRTGRYDQAEALFLEALQRMKALFGEQNEHVAWMYYPLVELSAARGRHKQAIDYFRQAVASGLPDGEWLESAEGLAPLHGLPEFEALLVELNGRTEGDAR